MKRLVGLALTAAAMLSAAALAAPERARIRGTVSAISGDTVTVHTTGGEDLSIKVGDSTKYLQVIKASLGDIDKDSYIGTATKTTGSALIALEVVVFPPSMKGVGEGHYPWDPLPDPTVAGGGATASMMTNGTVVSSMMTNGNVAATASKDGSKELTVTYKDGQQTILVPPATPIVTFKPGSVADVTKGAGVFIGALKDDGKFTANTVAIGMDGLRPPM